jgi:hypothetical protein
MVVHQQNLRFAAAEETIMFPVFVFVGFVAVIVIRLVVSSRAPTAPRYSREGEADDEQALSLFSDAFSQWFFFRSFLLACVVVRLDVALLRATRLLLLCSSFFHHVVL